MACAYSEELRKLQHELADFFGSHPRFSNFEIVAVIMDRRCQCIGTISDNPERSRVAARHLEVTATLRERDAISPDFPRNAGGGGS